MRDPAPDRPQLSRASRRLRQQEVARQRQERRVERHAHGERRSLDLQAGVEPDRCRPLDYLIRDASLSGLPGHAFDIERLLDMLLHLDRTRIAVYRRAVEPVEGYLLALDQMYRTVYYHHTAREPRRRIWAACCIARWTCIATGRAIFSRAGRCGESASPSAAGAVRRRAGAAARRLSAADRVPHLRAAR